MAAGDVAGAVSFPARIALSALARPERHRYAGDHPVQVADLHVPRGAGPFPVAAVVHGGYWGATYGKLTTRPVCIDLARRGWAAWNVEYRRLGRGQGGGWPATFDDLANAMDHLAALADPRLDLGRVVLVGHSAGGQLALWAAGRRDPVVAAGCVAALAPVTDLARAGAQARLLLGGTPDEVPERYADADPIRRAPLDVPVLVVHPADDALVPVRRSRVYVQTARARGGDVSLVEPPAGGHRAPIDPRHPAWHAAAEWLDARRALPAAA